jgi:hypothetical protein
MRISSGLQMKLFFNGESGYAALGSEGEVIPFD